MVGTPTPSYKLIPNIPNDYTWYAARTGQANATGDATAKAAEAIRSALDIYIKDFDKDNATTELQSHQKALTAIITALKALLPAGSVPAFDVEATIKSIVAKTTKQSELMSKLTDFNKKCSESIPPSKKDTIGDTVAYSLYAFMLLIGNICTAYEFGVGSIGENIILSPKGMPPEESLLETILKKSSLGDAVLIKMQLTLIKKMTIKLKDVDGELKKEATDYDKVINLIIAAYKEAHTEPIKGVDYTINVGSIKIPGFREVDYFERIRFIAEDILIKESDTLLAGKPSDYTEAWNSLNWALVLCAKFKVTTGTELISTSGLTVEKQIMSRKQALINKLFVDNFGVALIETTRHDANYFYSSFSLIKNPDEFYKKYAGLAVIRSISKELQLADNDKTIAERDDQGNNKTLTGILTAGGYAHYGSFEENIQLLNDLEAKFTEAADTLYATIGLKTIIETGKFPSAGDPLIQKLLGFSYCTYCSILSFN